MSEMALIKVHGVLVPANDETADRFQRLKSGSVLRGDFKKARNPLFHRKYWALLDTGFEAFEPCATETKYGPAEKNFERFRAQVTIQAGYFTPVFNMDGSVQLIPKSISFANMEEDEFAQLYSSVIDVLLAKVLGNYTRDDIDNRVAQIMDFA